MNIHIMRFISAIALTMITAAALAVGDVAINEIDSKASSANAKANGNNSRIQALEAEVDDLRTDLDNIELTPGPQGEPGNDAPNHTDELCVVYQAMIESGKSSYTEMPDFCAPVAPKTVFVTSTRYTGDLGGMEGADAKCQDHATDAGLPGRFKAWLAAVTIDAPYYTFTRSISPYIRTDGQVVANDWADLVDGGPDNEFFLQVPINKDQDGAEVSGNAWSNVSTSGRAAQGSHCHYWEFDSVNFNGELGLPTRFTDREWTYQDIFVECDHHEHIICFQQ